MKLLAIETATEACSAALLIDDDIVQRYELAPREHAKRILSMIDELMAEAQLAPSELDAIAFGRGPGSFIGVRIAAGVTQGIAYAADLPVVPVSTLAAIAQGTNADHALVAIDARMGEIYWGQFSRSAQTGLMMASAEEQLLPPHGIHIAIDEFNERIVGAGSGWQAYLDELSQHCPGIKIDNEHTYPTAQSVAQLATVELATGSTVSAEQALPLYLRDKVAEKPA